MKWEEVMAKVNQIVANPDSAQLEAVKFLEELKKDYTTLDSLSAEKEKSDERIRNLQDTNQRLFLMTTGQAVGDGKEENEKHGQEKVDEFIANLFNGEEE